MPPLPQPPRRRHHHCMMSYCLKEALKRSVRASSSSLLDEHAFQSALHQHQAGGGRGVEATTERGRTLPARDGDHCRHQPESRLPCFPTCTPQGCTDCTHLCGRPASPASTSLP